MTWMPNLRADLERYIEGPRTLRSVIYAACEMPVWAIVIYRMGKAFQRVRPRLVRLPLMAVYFVLYKLSEALSGIRISSEAEIGPGLMIHNFGGIIIKGKIGANCTVIQGAQIVARADNRGSGWPTLGDNVFVGSGAKILGKVTIGDNARIGANAVVMTNIPANAIVMPPESRILKNFSRLRKPAAPPADNTAETNPTEEKAPS